MTIQYMTRDESRAYRTHVRHGKQAIAAASALFAFLGAALAGNDLRMSSYLWAGVALVVLLLGLALVYFGLANGVTAGRDGE